jgi:hypothetical protein
MARLPGRCAAAAGTGAISQLCGASTAQHSTTQGVMAADRAAAQQQASVSARSAQNVGQILSA